MATVSGEVMSDEIKGIKCCFCLADNRTREADTYCVDCKDYYCSPCAETHKKVSATKGHKLLDKANFKSQGPEDSLQSVPTQRCSQHPTEVINMFCKDHNEVACAPCMFLNHRTCKTIHSIPEDIDNLYNRTELTNMKQKIHKMKTNMEEMKVMKENKVKELKEAYENEVKSIKAFCEDLQKLLDKMEQETIHEMKKEFDRIESLLKTEINDAKHLIDEMNKVSEQIRKAEGNRAQEFVSFKTSEKVTAQADIKQQQRKPEELVQFTPDQNIKAFLEKIQALGKITCKEQFISSPMNSLFKVKNSRDINVKLVSDSNECNIYGSCITEDGFLLLSDNKNKKLKRLDTSSLTVTDYLDLQALPLAVDLISKTEAAVTLNNNTVQFVSIGTKLTATHTLTMNHPCWGLAHKDDKLFISDSGMTVYIHDIKGQELKRISTDASGKEIFQSTRHITCSVAGDRLFVADMNKGLVILDIQGNYLTTLTDPTVSHTYGVCTDNGNLFVCGYSSNNIVQIGHDYKVLGELVKVKDPRSVRLDPQNQRLFATAWNTDNITVLELE